MVFPQTILPLKIELNLGGWTDVTSYVRRDAGLTITRGRANESAQAERTQLTMKLENTDGRFSERNPTGPYYGLLSLNTPCRVSTTRTTKVLDLPGGDTDYATTVDAAVLDITSDIDIRVDAHLHDWRTTSVLACKWRMVSPTVQRSWALETTSSGFLKLWWSSAGTAATVLSATSTSALSVTTGRLAVRVTLDVNNGAAGNTATFYTSDTISGSWTQLGSPVIAAGTTSIFSSSSAVEVGGYGEAAQSTADLTGQSVYGWLYGFQLLSGIAGTLVANPDFTAQSVGATSFADTTAAPRTWTLTSGASLTDRYWRFNGEISSWPQTWDTTKRDATVSVTAAGPLRRLTQGPTPLRSVIFQSVTADSTVLAYWPCEDASGSTSIASGLASGSPMQFNGTPTLASYAGFPGSENILLPVLAQFVGPVNAAAAATSSQMQFLLSIPAGGIGNAVSKAVRMFTSTGWKFNVSYATGSSGNLVLEAEDPSGTGTNTAVVSGLDGADLCITVDAVQNGANIDFALNIFDLGAGLITNATMSVAGTVGSIRHVTIGDGSQSLGAAAVGHIVVRTSLVDVTFMRNQLTGYAGEAAGTRFARLCSGAGIALRSIGDLASTEQMGPQKPGTLVDLLRECATTDLGMLFEPLDALGLGYRTRKSLENQTAGVLLNYSSHELATPPLPTGDDENVRNDYTVERIGGSKDRRELATGRMSTASPPDGVGRYTAQENISLYADTQLPDQASFRLSMGTVDVERYPQISVSRTTPAVVTNTTLNGQLLTLNVGDVIAVSNMPTPFVAPGQVRQIVQGWSEKLSNFEHAFTFNTTPATPWDFGILDDTTLGRADTEESVLASAVNSSATSLVVTTTAGPYWTEAAGDMPFDVSLGGETVTVSAIADAVRDTFTRTTSSGWGTATSGQAWTRSGGVAADFSTNGSAGAISVTAVNSERWLTLPETATAWDVEFRARTLVLAATQPINVYIGCMLTGTTVGYIARMAFYQDQTVRISIEEMPFALLASEVTVPGLTHAANTWFRLRFRVSDGQLMARAWLDGGTEPQFWHVYATDTTCTSGTVGVRTVLTTGNTSTLPVAVQYDDVTSHTPQTFTVTRGVNAVTKSQSAGADVRLTHPTIMAL